MATANGFVEELWILERITNYPSVERWVQP
jgi:hypothetical protein